MAKTTEQIGPIIDTTTFAVGELQPFHKNPRRGNVEMVAESLQINGQYRAIVVNVGTHTGRPLEVLAGNHTLAAAKQLGWKQITATTVDVDDLAAARIVAADNRTADLGGYDDELLADLLSGIAEDAASLAGTGYNEDDLEAILAIMAGPADLDALAEEYGEPRADDHHIVIRLSLDPITASRWDEHRQGWDTDTEALDALLNR